ncbi:uncharacterized protein LOC122064283 [Macadamia integrifolia]|uniref:uncharacterized protein LOC122064283 n=1 Tax=Macadamia integrifolia TaxID=60698 RepID=UPI001C4E6CCE|nr:uncharacterized protein LOC122064283 [Macadamia integrifolia]
MERRKHKASTDELDVMKAAAWEWYQHGSGSEGKTVREFDLTRPRRSPGPSRYKLEVMRMADDNTEEGSSQSRSIISLLDPYEVGRISKHLEYLIESTRDNYYDESHSSTGYQDRKKEGSLPESKKKKKKEKNSKRFNGFFSCGSRGDVVEGRMLVGRRMP